eukprot:732817-Hanusia_phi.AAC.1
MGCSKFTARLINPDEEAGVVDPRRPDTRRIYARRQQEQTGSTEPARSERARGRASRRMRSTSSWSSSMHRSRRICHHTFEES